MHLLTGIELNNSPVAANNRMNRQRVASGVHNFGQAVWLDLCCSEGCAPVQVAEYFNKQETSALATLKGIDLIDDFPPATVDRPLIQWEQKSLQHWQANETYDRVTMVHGLHYIGDKPALIEKAVNSLKTGGLFIAHLDVDSMALDDKMNVRFFKTVLMQQGFLYNGRTKLLQHPGSLPVIIGLRYLGADDASGPNYRGQEAIT